MLTDLNFRIVGARPDPMAAAPVVLLEVVITETTGTPVHALALRCQLRIEPTRRHYDDEEAAGLADLFGDRARWGSSLHPVQLAFLHHMVPGFAAESTVELALPCSYDFEVAAHKYLDALRSGEVPLLALFSGTVFTAGPAGVAVEPVPWHKEAAYRLPVAVWRATMDLHFPGTAWLRLGRDSFDALHRYRSAHALPTWDEAIAKLLAEAGE